MMNVPHKDKLRLDWLIDDPRRLLWLEDLWWNEEGRPSSPREAIDKEMERLKHSLETGAYE